MFNPAKALHKRPDGKLVLSGVTNELVQAVNDLMPNLGTGADVRMGQASSMVMLLPQSTLNSRPGFYFAKSIYARSAISSTITNTAIGTSDFGTISSTPTYLLMNPAEVGGGFSLSTNIPTPAIEVGYFTSNSQSYTLAVSIGPSSPTLTAMVNTSTRDGTNWRWTYTASQVSLTGTSPFTGSWVGVTGGFTGTCYNLNETNNTSSPLGNGVATGDFTGTITPQPVPNGTRVFLQPVNGVYFFEIPNGLTGSC